MSDVSEIPFSLFFQKYVIEVQDRNLENELNFFKNRNCLSIDSILKVISKHVEDMKQ